MKLYDCKPAPNPRRVRIFMAEKGIEIETVQIDLGSGEQFGEVFMKINPDCAVPVLELDDGSYISEVFAICHYLEDTQPEPSLLGTTNEERARILM
ncbi:MAG: glutathione S-transferase N-terminal domain-containing protein, partial [Planctomycetes bacterium]|nr:glutathione S-transferase N-terminal domain-containing protein [Planctomycetota bacterium]